MDIDQPHVRLLQEHAELETLLDQLLAAFDSGDRSVATAAFHAFDRRLSAHFAFEETVLLPRLATSDPRAADDIRAEHAVLRAKVEELAIEDNLHVSRATQVHRLVDLLRAHAGREQAVLYPLADEPEVRAGAAAAP